MCSRPGCDGRMGTEGEGTMHRAAAAIALALAGALSGCAADVGRTVDSGGPLSLKMIGSELFSAEYQRLSECAFSKLDTVRLRKAELPTAKTVKIARDSSEVRFWELSFVGVGPNQTRVDMAVIRGTWGN